MANKNFEKMLLVGARSRLPIIFASLMAGVLIGIFLQKKVLWKPTAKASTQVVAVRESQDAYKFINPLLFVETPESETIREVAPLQDEIQKFIDQKIESREAEKISVYFRDPKSGWWFGINEDEKYAPASLLKVPLMIALFKLAESNPALLNKQITYDGTFDANKLEHFPPAQSLVPGQTYSVEELIHAMIAYSDNNAYMLLGKNISPDSIVEVYRDLGIATPDSPDSIDFMTVKSYAYFFRALYNSTYLTRAYSEKAMELLGEVDFPQGIMASVPSSVPVANKFGERTIDDVATGQTSKELHDCGYVYYPSRPYLICIMTRGGNFDALVPIIQNISRMSYDWAKQKYK